MYNQTILRTTDVLMKSTGDTVSSLLTYCHWYAVFLRTKWFSHLNPGIDSFLCETLFFNYPLKYMYKPVTSNDLFYRRLLLIFILKANISRLNFMIILSIVSTI